MAVKRTNVEFGYGVGDALIPLAPRPIIAQRAPGDHDLAQLGTVWVDVPNSTVYMLASITSNVPNWTTSAGSGVGIFTSLDVDPGDATITSGDLIVSAGNIDVTVGNVTIGGDLTVGGAITLDGLVVISTAQIELTSSLDAPEAVLIAADGGTSETIHIISNQGTGDDSVLIESLLGGVTISTQGGIADSINLVVLTAGDMNLLNSGTGKIIIEANGTAQDSLTLTSGNDGGILIQATSASAGKDIDIKATGSSVNIESTEGAADAIYLLASAATGGIQISAGTGGIFIGNGATTTPIDIGDIAPTASRTITVGGGTVVTAAVTDLVDIAPDGATTNANSIKRTDINSGNVTTGQSLVNINTGTAASGTSTVNISTNTGGGTKTVNVGNADGLTTINLDGIALINDSVDVNTSINTGTSTGAVAIGNALAGAMSIDTAAGISLDAGAASNFTVAGAGIDLTLDSGAGRVIVNAEEAAANAITLLSVAGGLDANVALQMNLDSSQAAADAIRIVSSNAGGGIDIDSGTTGTAIDSTGAISLQAAAASDFSVSGAGIDLSLVSAGGRVVVNGEEAAADAVRLLSVAGGLDADFANNIAFDNSAGNITLNSAAGTVLIDSAGVLELNSSAGVIGIGNDAVAQNINIGTGAAARIVTVGNVTTTTEVQINTGTGGFNVASAGITTFDAVTNSTASPTASSTINANLGAATFTGFTTAAAASQVFTITNSLVTTASNILVTVCNEGANDAQMTVMRVKRAAGSFAVTTTNNGAAALNGDVTVTFFVLS